MPTSACPILYLSGTPRERGRAHGEQARAAIRSLIGEHFAFLEYSASHIVGVALTREQLLEISSEYLRACERFARDLVEEVRGIAEGSGVPFAEVFSLNTFIDIADMVRPETAQNYLGATLQPNRLAVQSDDERFRSSGGCTSFGAMAPATRDGKVYLGQTFDTKAVFEPYVCALVVKSGTEAPQHPDCTIATFAGIVGCAGINTRGVGVVINHLHTYDARPGVPFTFAVRKMLQAASAAEACEILAQSEPASGIHYLVGDERELRAVETSATKFEPLVPREGIWSHANHCDAAGLQAVEVELSVYSLCRGNRARELLEANAGTITAQTLAAVACDHVGVEDTICSHIEADAPRLRQYKTDFAVILDTHARAMDLFVGSPCEKKVERLGR